MNNQNILKFFGSKLNVSLDSSEFYDYEISKVETDYETDILNISNPLTYSSLVIDGDLSGFTSNRDTITLTEIDNTENDDQSIYSGITLTVLYSGFTSYFDTTGYTYSDIILNNQIYLYTGLTDENHYFGISGFNDTQSIDPTLSGFTENEIISGFTTSYTNCYEQLSGVTKCCSIPLKLNNKPWVIKFHDENNVCDDFIQRRTEEGWTLDFIFNRENFDWSDGGIFYYFGVRGETDNEDYADNNLTFNFTDDGRIQWSALHYSGYCTSDSGYTTNYYTSTGQTPQLCTTGVTSDFNITITFKRHRKLTDCDIPNDGGWNDLITGQTLTNSELDIMTGQTPVYETIEILNKKWMNERYNRLGVLKIYLNGKPIYKIDDWEEVVPSKRGVQPFIQSWGGHLDQVSEFNIKSIKYYEEPLNYTHIRHNFLTRLDDYDFEICGEGCEEDIFILGSYYIIFKNGDEIMGTQSNNLITYKKQL